MEENIGIIEKIINKVVGFLSLLKVKLEIVKFNVVRIKLSCEEAF
jgi:hypothetical protein